MKQKKTEYPIRNWSQYNASLKKRGRIDFWFDEKAIKSWYARTKSGRPGRPHRYADEAILCALMIRAVFHCKLRQLEGFLKSLIHLMGLDLETPHYSLICRRAKKLGPVVN